jgi:hypothetical protein
VNSIPFTLTEFTNLKTQFPDLTPAELIEVGENFLLIRRAFPELSPKQALQLSLMGTPHAATHVTTEQKKLLQKILSLHYHEGPRDLEKWVPKKIQELRSLAIIHPNEALLKELGVTERNVRRK